MLLLNEKYSPETLKGDKLLKIFDDLNAKYDQKYAEIKATKTQEQLETSKFQFLNEMPPKHTEVTDKLLEIINLAEHDIKIIQPYV